MFLVVLGVASVVAAITGLHWYAVDDNSSDLNVAGSGFGFDDLGHNADSLTAPVASAYFDWLAWTLLAVVVVTALLARAPTRFSRGLRVVACVTGVAGVVATYYAVAQLFNAQRVAGGAEHSVWHNSSYGLWAALAGFALLALVGARAPRGTD